MTVSDPRDKANTAGCSAFFLRGRFRVQSRTKRVRNEGFNRKLIYSYNYTKYILMLQAKGLLQPTSDLAVVAPEGCSHTKCILAPKEKMVLFYTKRSQSRLNTFKYKMFRTQHEKCWCCPLSQTKTDLPFVTDKNRHERLLQKEVPLLMARVRQTKPLHERQPPSGLL